MMIPSKRPMNLSLFDYTCTFQWIFIFFYHHEINYVHTLKTHPCLLKVNLSEVQSNFRFKFLVLIKRIDHWSKIKIKISAYTHNFNKIIFPIPILKTNTPLCSHTTQKPQPTPKPESTDEKSYHTLEAGSATQQWPGLHLCNCTCNIAKPIDRSCGKSTPDIEHVHCRVSDTRTNTMAPNKGAHVACFVPHNQFINYAFAWIAFNSCFV